MALLVGLYNCVLSEREPSRNATRSTWTRLYCLTGVYNKAFHGAVILVIMPAAVLPPPKRPLSDSTKAHRNVNPTFQSPNAAKRRKLEGISSPSPNFKSSQNGIKPGSSQTAPKSQFEEEVLEKLTQDMTGLKEQNSEKDQQWNRPSLDGFNPESDNLCFQQIEAEEGTLHGGQTTVKLFGVTEVSQNFQMHPCVGR